MRPKFCQEAKACKAGTEIIDGGGKAKVGVVVEDPVEPFSILRLPMLGDFEEKTFDVEFLLIIGKHVCSNTKNRIVERIGIEVD